MQRHSIVSLARNALGRRMPWRPASWLCAAFLMSCQLPPTWERDPETTLCGIKEPVMFWLWRNAAGEPDSSRLAGLGNAVALSFTTRDRRVLAGHKLVARSGDGPAKGALLVVQGNAMLADQVLPAFRDYAAAGFDVYAFDYRGYGRSEGRPRLKAILVDYRQIVAHLETLAYERHLFYAMSFGGVVLLDALKDRPAPGRVAIDSTPSRLSDHGCPLAHDPVATLPDDASRFLFVAGLEDRVVTPEMGRELVDLAGARGARVLVDPGFAHPFMGRDAAVHRRRMTAVRSFLLQDP